MAALEAVLEVVGLFIHHLIEGLEGPTTQMGKLSTVARESQPPMAKSSQPPLRESIERGCGQLSVDFDCLLCAAGRVSSGKG